MIFRGGVIWISKSISVPAPEQLKWFGAGYLPEWGPKFTGMNNSTLLLGIIGIAAYVVSQLKKYKKSAEVTGVNEPKWAVGARILLVGSIIAYFTWLFGTGREGTSFPVPGLILLILIIIYHTITQKTKFGRNVYAVGGNKNAAALSGVNVARTYFFAISVIYITFITVTFHTCARRSAFFFTTVQIRICGTFRSVFCVLTSAFFLITFPCIFAFFISATNTF